MHKNKRIIFAISVCVFLSSLVFGGNASARIVATSEQLYKLSILQGVVDCYEEYAKSSLPFSEFVNYNGNSFNLSIFDITNSWSSERIAWVTTHVGNSYGNRESYGEEESHLSCNAIFEGSNFGNGLKQYYSVPSAEASEELKFYGYAKKPNYGSGAVNENSVAKISIASIVDESGNSLERIKTEGKIECSGFLQEGSYEWIIDDCMGSIKASFRGQNIFTITTDGWQYDYSSGYFQVTSGLIQSDSECSASWYDTLRTFTENLTNAASNLYLTRSDGQVPPKDREYPLADILNESWFKEYLSIIIEGRGDNIGMAQGPLCGMSIYNKPKADIEISAGTNSGDSGGGVSDVYVPFDSKRSAGYNFLYNLGVDDDLPHANVDVITPSGGYAPRFVLRYLWTTGQAKWDYIYALYYKYVQNVIISHPASFDIRIGICSESKPDVRYAVKVAKDTWCAINISGEFDDWADNAIVSVVNQYATGLTRGTFKDVLEKLSDENFYNKISDDAYADLVPDEDGNVDIGDIVDDAIPPDTTGADPCFANAGSFGWVVCPAIDGMAEATDGISGLLNDWLSIDVNLYDGDSGTYDAWGYFRTFANVAIIIVMLVVIFSQLTGVGIDNYGIKKLLPKIIITAILINLSYVICELVIDLSNILGVGLNHLFQSVGRTVDSALSPGQVTQTVVGYLLAGLAGAGALAGSVITIVGAASGGAAMVIVTLILILLTALVAVLLFFMAIGARAIIVILFTAIAPVAVVMYALPNTQGIFKKYINIFKTALVVYPICGGLYGISYVIRGIVFGSGEVPFHMAMVVLCAPYLPFFALPSLTKGALAGLGAVGAAFTALGAGIRNGIGKGRKAAEGTDAYRKGMERGKVGLAARRAQAFKRRDDRRTARGIRNAGDRARFNELNDRINSGQRLSDPEKEEYRRLSGSSSYRRSEAREARYASANETIRAHEDQRGKNRINSDNLVAAGMLEGDRYKNDKAREEAEGWMDDYLVDSSGNTWIANGNGGYTTVDRSGRSRTLNATQARDMLQNGGRLVSRREAMSGRDRISRADETGRLAAHANSDRVTAAAAGSRLANLETSQSGLRDAALSGRDDVIMLQHDKNVDKRRGVIGEAEAYEEFRGLEGASTTISREAARQAAREKLEDVSAKNRVAADYANRLANGDYAPDGRTYDRAAATLDSIRTKAMKGLNQKDTEAMINQVGEVGVDLNVARANAQSAHNTTAGKQQAMAEFLREGRDVVTSVNAARQAAETQLAGTVGQNLSADDYENKVNSGVYDRTEVRNNAIEAARIKNINQTTNTIESNAAGEVEVNREVARTNARNAYNLADAKNNQDLVPEITPDYARSVEQSRFNTTQQRIYGEQLSNNTRNQSLADLVGALVGNGGTVGTIKGTAVGGEHMNSDQVNYVTAAIKDVMAKGGVEDLNRLIMNASGTIAAKPELAEAIYSEMATMSVEPEMKAYGKYAMGKIEKIKNGERNVTMLDYDGWLNAADNAGDLDGKESLAGYIRANGDTVLVGASKDTFKFYEGDGDLTNKFSPTQVLKGALSARDGETRVAANKMLRKRIGSDDAALTQAINGITISQWANMESGTLNALMGNHINNPGQVSGDLKASLEEVGRKLKGSGPTVKANIRPEVKAYFKQLGIDIDIKGKS